jgi:carbon-monoxide dehydrogenase large subunit
VLVGASPKRKEDGRFVAGGGRYLDDVRVPGLLHLALVRSPHARARPPSITSHAHNWVIAVLTSTPAGTADATVPRWCQARDRRTSTVLAARVASGRAGGDVV